MTIEQRSHRRPVLRARRVEPAPPAFEPPPLTPGSALTAVWLFLRRNAMRTLAIAAVTGPALFAALYFLLSQYTATAMVVLDPRPAHITQGSSVLANIGADFNAVESLVQITRSEGFVGGLVDKLELTHDADFRGKGPSEAELRAQTIDKLSRKLSVSRKGSTYVLEVTASAPSGEKAARIANAAAELIVEGQRDLRSGASAATAEKIEARLAELRGRVTRAEEAAAELKAKLKVTDAGQNQTQLERRVYELTQQQVLAGARTAEARARYELLRKAGATAGEKLPAAIQSTVLSTLRAEYARLSRQSADQATVLGARHPEVASLRAQIADVRQQIGVEITRMMAGARSDFQEAEQREAALSRQLADAQTQSGELGPQMVELSELEREAKAERAAFEQLLTRQRELTQTKNLDPNDIRVASEATAPLKPAPARSVLAAGSAVFGLLLGALWSLVAERRRPTLRTPKETERAVGAAVLGLAPLLPGANPSSLRRSPDLTPRLDELCTGLLAERSRSAIVVLVSSARRGEGRTTVAANLARWFSDSGERVLLMEADRPSADRARAKFGLLDVLDRGERLRAALIRRPLYTLLPFGGAGETQRKPPAALMNGVTLRATLGLLRGWFDVIVIDGPPTLDSSYAHLLAAQADAVVLVIEWDKTAPGDVSDALARLGGDAALLLNKADSDRLRLFDPVHSRRMAASAQSNSAEAA